MPSKHSHSNWRHSEGLGSRISVREGLLAVNKKQGSVEGVIHRVNCFGTALPRFPKLTADEMGNKQQKAVAEEERISAEEIMKTEIATLRQEVNELRRERKNIIYEMKCIHTHHGRSPLATINKKSPRSIEVLSSSVKKIDMSAVLKDMGKVKLRRIDRSPGGTPRRASAESSTEPHIGQIFRARFHTLKKVRPGSSGESSEAPSQERAGGDNLNRNLNRGTTT
uniref:PKcGMP_CC domain-containing protein n=1 Tax=Steinernema glaseri TaxID=37863 RepID=A0A1I8AA20_9BILA